MPSPRTAKRHSRWHPCPRRALIGDNADRIKFTEAFIKLNAAEGLILVDWRQQLALESVSSDGLIQFWRP
jgi:hypothetical protein